MRTKIFLPLTLAFFSISTFSTVAYSIPTKWQAVDVSMSDLLNSGWQIVAQSTTRVVGVQPGGAYNVTTFAYTLHKSGKYISCFVENPKPPIAQVSSCRQLN
jgi:hypothetical protein